MTEICAVLNVHSEGLLAHSSLLSIIEAKKVAEARKINVEILVVADCADKPTREYLQTAEKLGARILQTDVDDLGLARNAAVDLCDTQYVAFLDGDDLWTSNWLVEAYLAATQDQRLVVWHPEANLYFGATKPYWSPHLDMDDHCDTWMRLGLRNLWTSLAFASREVFVRVPYRKTELKSQFGYEDWYWNAETIAHGFIHKVVPDTAHLIRVSPTSLLRRTGVARALMTPTSLFRRRLADRISGLSLHRDGVQ